MVCSIYQGHLSFQRATHSWDNLTSAEARIIRKGLDRANGTRSNEGQDACAVWGQCSLKGVVFCCFLDHPDPIYFLQALALHQLLGFSALRENQSMWTSQDRREHKQLGLRLVSAGYLEGCKHQSASRPGSWNAPRPASTAEKSVSYSSKGIQQLEFGS